MSAALNGGDASAGGGAAAGAGAGADGDASSGCSLVLITVPTGKQSGFQLLLALLKKRAFRMESDLIKWKIS